MKLSLIVRGQHPANDDIGDRLRDDLELVRRAEEVGFDGIEAELLGARDEIEIVGEAFPHVIALRVLPANDQAQFHSLFSLTAPPDR